MDIRKNPSDIEEYLQLDPVVPIKLGYKDNQKDYKLEMNNFAVLGILKDTGYNLLSTGFTVGTMQDPAVLGSMLYWSLKTYHPELTEDEVSKLYTFRQSPYIISMLSRCLAFFAPEKDKTAVEAPTKTGDTPENP